MTAVTIPPESPMAELATSFARSLRAARKSHLTVEAYLRSILEYDRWAVKHGAPRDVSKIQRKHVEGYIEDQHTRLSPATASVRHAGLRRFMVWCVEEGEVAVNPMEKVRAPKVPETLPMVLTDDQVERLISAAEGPTFRQRRDTALLLFMTDTGTRRSEVAGIKVSDIDLEQRVALVHGKGDKERVVPYSDRTSAAIDRYLRMRKKHRAASSPMLWLSGSPAGTLGADGIAEVVVRRSRMAGVLRPDGRPLHAHLTRHYMADRALRNGVPEGDLATIGGWVPGSAAMRGYARGNRTDRAHASMRRVFGDT